MSVSAWHANRDHKQHEAPIHSTNPTYSQGMLSRVFAVIHEQRVLSRLWCIFTREGQSRSLRHISGGSFFAMMRVLALA